MHDHHGNSQHNPKPEAAQGNNKPMMRLPNGDTIPEGGYGRTRDGRKVGPIVFCEQYKHYRWNAAGYHGWTAEGDYGFDEPTASDIIAAWTEEPTADTLTTWADMTPEEKGALLLAHHEGKVIEFVGGSVKEWRRIDPPWWHWHAYRIRPEPKRETVTLTGHNASGRGWSFSPPDNFHDTHELTFDLIDDKPPLGEFRNEKGETIKIEPVK